MPNNNSHKHFRNVPVGFGVITPLVEPKKKRVNKNELMPADYSRIALVGGSGCGKTTLAENLVTKQWLENDIIIWMARNLNQPFYQLLREFVEENDYGDTIFFFDQLIELDKLAVMCGCGKGRKTILVVDDFITKIEDPIILDYFSRSRHYCMTLLVLLQDYGCFPTKYRSNTSHLALFQGSVTSKRRRGLIFNDFLNGTDVDKFHKLCSKYISKGTEGKNHNFLWIDVDAVPSEKVRVGLTEFVDITSDK